MPKRKPHPAGERHRAPRQSRTLALRQCRTGSPAASPHKITAARDEEFAGSGICSDRNDQTASLTFARCRSSSSSAPSRCRRGLSGRSSSINASALVKMSSESSGRFKSFRHDRDTSCSVNNVVSSPVKPGSCSKLTLYSRLPGRRRKRSTAQSAMPDGEPGRNHLCPRAARFP